MIRMRAESGWIDATRQHILIQCLDGRAIPSAIAIRAGVAYELEHGTLKVSGAGRHGAVVQVRWIC
jgi:hypothetical protein